MTQATLIKYVQAHFNAQSSQFRSRIVGMLPMALEKFAGERQWEFLDKLETGVSTATDSDVSKDYIDVPDDFAKPVAMWTDNFEVRYVDRRTWGEKQRATLPSGEPRRYTVIGTRLYLDRSGDGSTVDLVYTREPTGMSLVDVPSRYHTAVAAAVVWLLTPGFQEVSGTMVPNPAWQQAEAIYESRVRLAAGDEMAIKGRPMMWQPTDIQKARSGYR